MAVACCSLKELVVNKSCIHEHHLATIKHTPSVFLNSHNLYFHEQSKSRELEVAVWCPINCKVCVRAAVKPRLLTLSLTVGTFVIKICPPLSTNRCAI